MTTLLPIPFHPRATDEDIVMAIAEVMRGSHVASLPTAFRIVVGRLRDVYGRRLVDRALRQYELALRQENRSLKRQVRLARAAWIKRTGL
jgi:hypothetical protein